MIEWSSCKPAVPRRWLMGLAGILWGAVGVMLCRLAIGWLQPVRIEQRVVLLGLGLALAAGMYRAAFSRLVARNLERIGNLPARGCLFAFQPWKSYLVIVFMVMLGLGLRRSALPRPVLAVVYITIGVALILGGIKYWRRMFSGRPSS